ncbi:hypothetical protein Tco_0566429 [Tanacetum coccineum]
MDDQLGYPDVCVGARVAKMRKCTCWELEEKYGVECEACARLVWCEMRELVTSRLSITGVLCVDLQSVTIVLCRVSAMVGASECAEALDNHFSSVSGRLLMISVEDIVMFE